MTPLVLDVQLLLYAVFNSYTEHSVAHAWFEVVLNDPASLVGLPNHSLLGFIRLATKPRPHFTPLSMEDALEQVRAWIDWPNVFVPQPSDGHIRRVADLLRLTHGNHELVSDAHLAALAMEHRATMCTHDTDFARFVGLSVFDPLLPPTSPTGGI